MNDVLSEEGIRKYLDKDAQLSALEVHDTVGSTNTLLKELAQSGCPEFYTIVASAQTGGRGRMGRSFYSPEDTGVYLSLLLRPGALSPADAVKITTMAAVAACEAAESVSGRKAGIKWVNDVFIGGKKAMGILTEAAFRAGTGSIDYAVLGIGMNAYAPEGGFPSEIKDIAGTVFTGPVPDGRNRLAAEFLNRFLNIYRAGESSGYAEKYRARSIVIGRWVNVLRDGESVRALALDVDKDCHLIVKYENGSTEALSTGEISIRLR